MAFTDDLQGLSRAAQIARVQAVARECGDELDDTQADQALSLYTALAADTDSRVIAGTPPGAGRARQIIHAAPYGRDITVDAAAGGHHADKEAGA